LKTHHDALVLFIHALLLKSGFRLANSLNSSETPTIELPDKWNEGGVYTFTYKHLQSSLTFIIKCLSIEDKLLVHAMTKEDSTVRTLELKVSDYVYDNVELHKYSSLFRDLQRLIGEVKVGIVNKIVPGITKPGYEQTDTSAVNSNPNPNPNSIPNPNPNPNHSNPLFLGGYQPQPHGPPRFGGGRGDAFPFLNPGGPGFPNPNGHGNLIGPNHPDFHQPHYPSFNNPNSGFPFNLPPGAIPPGARFDPFGPPPPPGSFRHNPDFDYPPPDDDSYFS